MGALSRDTWAAGLPVCRPAVVGLDAVGWPMGIVTSEGCFMGRACNRTSLGGSVQVESSARAGLVVRINLFGEEPAKDAKEPKDRRFLGFLGVLRVLRGSNS